MLAIAVVLLLVVAQLGGAAADRAAARTAADAAALAAATAANGGGASALANRAADEAARRNGATLTSVQLSGDRAEVAVRVGRASASAVATVTEQAPRGPVSALPPGVSRGGTGS